MTTLLDQARSMADDLTALRHRLHRRPELGLSLPWTQEQVLAELDGLGLEVSTGTACTSVTAVLRGAAGAADQPADQPAEQPADQPADEPADEQRQRRVVLLRGDMDALPVHEEVDVPFRSTVDGAMHACGHDLHTTMLIGAARILAAGRERLPGDVVFMFQPGEEGYNGAGQMIDEGVLEAAGRRPDAAFALHVMSGLVPNGTVVTRPGALMAASDGLFVTVRGRGGHGSTPHLAADPVPAACEMVLALQTAITRTVDTFAPAVLTVGTFRAGTQRNIIPDSASFEATVRTFDPAIRAVLDDLVQRVCQGIAVAHGVEVDVRYVAEYPQTVNDAASADFALAVASELFPQRAVVRLPNPIMGSEDFSRVLDAVPGAMIFLGAVAPGVDAATAPSNHSPLAAFDDAVLPDGAAYLAELATRTLAG